jgi:hypothetical protein
MTTDAGSRHDATRAELVEQQRLLAVRKSYVSYGGPEHTALQGEIDAYERRIREFDANMPALRRTAARRTLRTGGLGILTATVFSGLIAAGLLPPVWFLVVLAALVFGLAMLGRRR